MTRRLSTSSLACDTRRRRPFRKRALAALRGEELVLDRVVDRARHRPPVHRHRHRGGEEGVAVGEVHGAVEGVHVPDRARARALEVGLLGHDVVVGEARADDREDLRPRTPCPRRSRGRSCPCGGCPGPGRSAPSGSFPRAGPLPRPRPGTVRSLAVAPLETAIVGCRRACPKPCPRARPPCFSPSPRACCSSASGRCPCSAPTSRATRGWRSRCSARASG